jgi:hypothetical protein
VKNENKNEDVNATNVTRSATLKIPRKLERCSTYVRLGTLAITILDTCNA